ncbi:MAG TPA: hypothetical protein VFS39_13320 [Nitrospira sp.]|nr:hypothetical protein [Nitrospira sp.]
MKRLLFARVAAVACLSMLTLLPAQGEEAPASLLWRDVPSPSQDPPLPPRKPWVIRDREIVFNPQLLAILKDASARPHPPLFIELFQARPYELDVSATVSRLSDLSTIKGTIKQSAHATWSLVINGSIVSGTFQIGDRLYKIEHVQNGRHRLSEVDPAKMPAE